MQLLIRNPSSRNLLRGTAASILLLLGSAVIAKDAPLHSANAVLCEVGSYLMADGTSVDIAAGAPGKLRWRLPDGRTGALTPEGKGRWKSTLGWTDRPDGHEVSFSECKRGEIRFDGLKGQRRALIEIDTRFQGSGDMLAGRLTLPPGDARVPLVVLIHGAEHDSALDDYSLQREFAAAGIGVFAYDKRGTGASGGRYSQHYLLLATDAVLAVREARRLAGERAGRVGYQGGSQGGWVAPLAAKIEPVDFVIVSFGLAVSVLDEDREAIEFDMERAGFGPDIKARARDVADATAAVVTSDFTEGYEQLEAVKRKYSHEPWFKSVRGNYTSHLLAGTPDLLRKEGPRLLEGLAAQYDPMPVLTNLDVPQLWILGGQDRDAPPKETLRRLASLRNAGRPITTAVFPNADHGMYEFETLPDGERVSTRQPDGYFRIMADFIKGAPLAKSYGTAEITGSTVAVDENAEKETILALIARMEQAWNRGDFRGYMEGFANPDVIFVSRGEFQKDWQSTLDHYIRDYGASAQTRGTLHFFDIKIEMLSPDTAQLISRYRLDRPSKSQDGINTRLMRKRDGKWVIALNHVSSRELP